MDVKEQGNVDVLPWYEACDKIRPYVVRITTPTAQGTGFVLAESDNGEYLGIATACHVVEYPDYWRMPIRIERPEENVSRILTSGDYLTVHEKASDLSMVIIRKDAALQIAQGNVSFFYNPGKVMKRGVSIGWLGFPNVEPNVTCFFRGYVSAYINTGDYYLVDGVAINGVSGGPVFDQYGEVIGILSAYKPNLATGSALPGLAVVGSVEPLIRHVKSVRNLGRREEVTTPPTPPTPPAQPPAISDSAPPPRAKPPSGGDPPEGGSVQSATHRNARKTL